MAKTRKLVLWLLLVAALPGQSGAQPDSHLPDSGVLTWQGDLSARMVAGIDRFLERRREETVRTRSQRWNRDYSSPEAYADSVEINRERLRSAIGIRDSRLAPRLELFVEAGAGQDPLLSAPLYRVWRARWDVLPGIQGEGLLLQPAGRPVAQVVALPDAGQTPEQLAGVASGLPEEAQFARKLAEAGCQVIVPVLISRSSDFSGNPDLPEERWTNMPHREWLYRMSYEMGRHIIGFEVQKVLAAVDWFESNRTEGTGIAVAGYGEGGLIGLYSAALDRRIGSCLASGYFGPRESLWSEPIYRNIWGLLREFGDAEIGSLVLPRNLVIESSVFPEIAGPPEATEIQRSVAAPGSIRTPSADAVEAEFLRLVEWAEPLCDKLDCRPRRVPEDPASGPVTFGSEAALQGLLAPFVSRPVSFPDRIRSDPVALVDEAVFAKGSDARCVRSREPSSA